MRLGYHLPVLEPGTAADRQSTISFAASCDAMDADSQTDCGDCDRGHIRVNYVGSPQYFQFAAGQVVSTGQSVVVGTPHTELWDEDCKPGPLGIGSKGGHRTIDYNGARNAVTLAMASEHPWEAAPVQQYSLADPVSRAGCKLCSQRGRPGELRLYLAP
jgi:hypothetical protein